MSNPRAIRMVNHFTKREMELTKQAYRDFFKNFDCNKCPLFMSDDLSCLAIGKHARYQLSLCQLCHGFPTLTHDMYMGCPCRVLGKRTAKMRLKKLIEAWDANTDSKHS